MVRIADCLTTGSTDNTDMELWQTKRVWRYDLSGKPGEYPAQAQLTGGQRRTLHQPVFHLEFRNAGKVPETAADQSQIVGDGDGGYFQIGDGQRGSRTFESGAEVTACVGGLAVEYQDIACRQEDFLEIGQMKIGVRTFAGAINNFGHSNGGNILLPRRNSS